MAFDFKGAFSSALKDGVAAAKPGGQAAEDWIREAAKANEATLRSIAEGALHKEISKGTAEHLLRLNASALRSEAAALGAILTATAQAAVNAFLGSLFGSLKAGLKLAL